MSDVFKRDGFFRLYNGFGISFVKVFVFLMSQGLLREIIDQYDIKMNQYSYYK